MSEAEAVAKLKADALANYQTLRDAVAAVAGRITALRSATDIFAAMRAVDSASLALADLASVASQLSEQMRLSLVATMEKEGAPSFENEGHVTSTRRTPKTVEIIDAAAVPAEFMTTPEPRPDTRKIAAWLRERSAYETNWARLHDGGVTLARRPK